MNAATALLAEDEPLLAQALQAELARTWPTLGVLATVGDGPAAVREALALRPDVLFLNIRIPGQSGVDAAAELAERWEGESAPACFPALVFVTAYDQYAVQAFEAQAVDYVLKPVQPARLARTVARVQTRLARDRQAAPDFEASDRYVCVHTVAHEFLLRTPLKELLPQLDPQVFWQVHRGTVDLAEAIESVQRDEAGKLSLQLRGRPQRLGVSRLYAHLFRSM